MRITIMITAILLVICSCNNTNTRSFAGSKWQLADLTAAENNRLDLYEVLAVDEFQNKNEEKKTIFNFLNDSTYIIESTSDTSHYRINKDTLFLGTRKTEKDTFLIALHNNDSLQLNSLKGMQASFKKLP